MWIWFFILALLLFIFFLFWFRRRDRLYFNRPVREVLGEEVKKEIEEERAQFARHQKMFEKKLNDARLKFQGTKK